MNQSSDFIWQLIHSLSSAEKLFFKRNFFIKKEGSTTLYVKLFDAIAHQKKYDEAVILKKFSPALNKGNIAYQKHYLQKQISDALLIYEGITNENKDIYKQILLIRIYRKKGLVSEANGVWQKAIAEARKSEAFEFVNLLKTEFEKMLLFGSPHVKLDELHSVFNEHFISYTEYAEMITLRDIYTSVLFLKRKAHFGSTFELHKNAETLLTLLDRHSLIGNFQSFWYRHYYFMSKATLLYVTNDISNSHELFKNVLNDWKKNEDFIKTHGEYYIELLNMINYVGVLIGDYEFVKSIFTDGINKNLREPAQKAGFEAVKFLALNKIFNKTAQYDEVEKLMSGMKTKQKQMEENLSSDLVHIVNISMGISCFVLEQYSDALFFLKKSIDVAQNAVKEESLAMVNMLLLLVAFCMDNAKLFDPQYKTIYRYFYKRKKRHNFEAALLQCLYSAFYAKDQRTKAMAYEKALKAFENNEEDSTQQRVLKIFNYQAWLKSKIKRCSYRQYVTEQIKKTASLSLSIS